MHYCLEYFLLSHRILILEGPKYLQRSCFVPHEKLDLKSNERTLYYIKEVLDDLKLRSDSEGVLIYKWSSWPFDSLCEIFSLLDGETS
jgi:hypothetical protein